MKNGNEDKKNDPNNSFQDISAKDIEKNMTIENSQMKQTGIDEKTRLMNFDKNMTNTNNYSSITNRQEVSIDMNEVQSFWDLYKGFIYMMLSCIFKSLFSILTKLCLKDKSDLSSFQLLTYRTYFMLWISILMVIIGPVNIFSENFIKKDKVIPVMVRTLFAIISMSLVVFSIKFMHISDVYSVYYIYPAFIILLSLCFLKKEKLGWFDFCCLGACFIGALFIVKPEFLFYNEEAVKSSQSNGKILFFLLVIIAAFLKALEDVIVRNVGKDAHYLIFPFMYSLFGMVLFPVPMLLFDKYYPKFSIWEVVIVFLIAVCTFLYQTFMAMGLQNEKAGRVSMINYAQVALMYISDLTIFDKTLNFWDLTGTIIIFGFNIANGVIKTLKRSNDLEEHLRNKKIANSQQK
jgi:drug/metabolite transporter (DMT)-like permease